MRRIARFAQARGTAEGKFLSVLLSVLLVFPMANVAMFTERAAANEEGVDTGFIEQVDDVEKPAADAPETNEPSDENSVWGGVLILRLLSL